MWVTFNDELTMKALYKRNADLQRSDEKIGLIKFIPYWAYERNKQLQIFCRLEREKDKMQRTQIKLGRKTL